VWRQGLWPFRIAGQRDQSPKHDAQEQELLIFKPPLDSMKPSFRNLFVKTFTRERPHHLRFRYDRRRQTGAHSGRVSVPRIVDDTSTIIGLGTGVIVCAVLHRPDERDSIGWS
jgi:hypothetical protein